jgi:hypothetical protein
MLAAVSQNAFDAGDAGAFAVRFLTGSHSDSIATYDAKWLDQDAQMLARHGGTLTWRARLNPLSAEREQRFDEMLIYGFTDTESRGAWVGDNERETLQTLERRLFRRDVLVLADSQTMVQPPPQPESVAPAADARPGDAPSAPDGAPAASDAAPGDASGGAANDGQPAGPATDGSSEP